MEHYEDRERQRAAERLSGSMMLQGQIDERQREKLRQEEIMAQVVPDGSVSWPSVSQLVYSVQD